jgi:probable phosphoglycerate mutase
MPLNAYFVRHGQTAWNVEQRLQGQADTGLNALGEQQAAANGRRLAGLLPDPAAFDFVASPLLRTRRTMEVMRAAIGLDPFAYRTDPRLMELHFGDWQGLTLAEVEARAPGSIAARTADKWNFCPPGEKAESYAMLTERVRSWLEDLARPTVCVTHGGVIRALFVLSGVLSPAEAAERDISQDSLFRLDEGGLAEI